MAGDEQLVVPLEAGRACCSSRRGPPRSCAARLAAWRAGSSGHRSCSRRSPSSRATRFHLGATALVRPRRPRRCVPLAWLIGEATEHAAEHTGPGVGGFLNASFGNAPELIIALLRDRRRAAERRARHDRRLGRLEHPARARRRDGLRRRGEGRRALAALAARAVVAGASRCSSIPSIPGWNGSPEPPRALRSLTLPVARRAARRLRRRSRCATCASTATPSAPTPARARVVAAHGARRARARDARDRVRLGGARALARRLRQGGRARRVLHRGRDRRARRQRRRARRRDRDRAAAATRSSRPRSRSPRRCRSRSSSRRPSRCSRGSVGTGLPLSFRAGRDRDDGARGGARVALVVARRHARSAGRASCWSAATRVAVALATRVDCCSRLRPVNGSWARVNA